MVTQVTLDPSMASGKLTADVPPSSTIISCVSAEDACCHGSAPTVHSPPLRRVFHQHCCAINKPDDNVSIVTWWSGCGWA